MNFEPSDRSKDYRERVRSFIQKHIQPVEAQYWAQIRSASHGGDWRQWKIPPVMEELKARAKAEGLWNLFLPDEKLGAGLSTLEYAPVAEEMGRSFMAPEVFNCNAPDTGNMEVLWRYGSEEQKKQWLPRLASGQEIGCFGLTEPDYGSNPAGMITTARETSDGWVLNGVKMWITNGSQATVSIIWAKTGDVNDARSIRGFIVPADTPGYTGRDQKGKLSLRASDTSEIHLQDVHLPKDAILPKSGGIKSPLMCLTQARYGIAWGGVGAAMACYDEALRYAQQRIMFGKPIAQTQLQQQRLADMLTEITKAQLLCLQLGRLKDAGTMTPQQVSLAKRNNVNMATDIAREARRLLGANGILAEYHAMRHMANLESVYTYEGTHDMHTLILGQAVTGMEAF